MTRKLAILLCLLSLGFGIVVGTCVQQNALQNAVIVANAKADTYGLAALDLGARLDKCGRGEFFKR